MSNNVREAWRDLSWPYKYVGPIVTGIAIWKLGRQVFGASALSAPFALIMEAYNLAAQLLLGWLEPWLQTWLTWLGSFVGWRPTLYPHWKDVLVFVGLYAAAMARAESRHGWRKVGWIASAFLTLGALLAALAAGLLQLESNDLTTQVLIATTPAILWLSVACYVPFSSIDPTPWKSVGIALFGAVAYAFMGGLLAWFVSEAGERTAGAALIAIAIVIFGQAVVGTLTLLGGNRYGGTTGLVILGALVAAALLFGGDAALKP